MFSLVEHDARVEGLEAGRLEAKIDSVRKLVVEGVLDAERACEIIGIPFETYLDHDFGDE